MLEVLGVRWERTHEDVPTFHLLNGGVLVDTVEVMEEADGIDEGSVPDVLGLIGSFNYHRTPWAKVRCERDVAAGGPNAPAHVGIDLCPP